MTDVSQREELEPATEDRTASDAMAGEEIRQVISGQWRYALFLGIRLGLGIYATPWSTFNIRLENVSKLYNKHWSVAKSGELLLKDKLL